MKPSGPKGITYLDSAATTLKPQAVVERVSYYLLNENGSPNRGAHTLSVVSTQLYKASKRRVACFLNAPDNYHVVYTKNATESLNLVAQSLPQNALGPGDEVVIPITAHHSNILPWQRLVKERGAKLVYLYVDDQGEFLPGELSKIGARTRLVSFPYVSNGLGVVHPADEIISRAHQVGALVVVDGAQAVGHIPVDLAVLDADIFIFSAHKLYAPTGLGVLVGKSDILEDFEPFLLGGDMIEYVTEQEATFAPLPERLEAGTQNVMGAIGLMAAIDWLETQGVERVYNHERDLVNALYDALASRPDVEVYGPKPTSVGRRGALVCFNVKGVHPHDVASILDAKGVAIRAGHHCCQPLMAHLKLGATCRASIGAYNTEEDIAVLMRALDAVGEVFKGYA